MYSWKMVPLNQKTLEAGKLKKDIKGNGFECMLHILLAHGLKEEWIYRLS